MFGFCVSPLSASLWHHSLKILVRENDCSHSITVAPLLDLASTQTAHVGLDFFKMLTKLTQGAWNLAPHHAHASLGYIFSLWITQWELKRVERAKETELSSQIPFPLSGCRDWSDSIAVTTLCSSFGFTLTIMYVVFMCYSFLSPPAWDCSDEPIVVLVNPV